MKVSIIGLGWLGLQLAERFSQAGFEVKGTVRSSDKANTLNHLQVDICLYEFPNQAPDTVFDADALILTIPPGKIEDYLGMVWTLTEEIKLSSIRKIVFLSSVSVYPECNQTVDESYSGQPDSPQGKTLLEAEKMLLGIRGKTVSICRLGGLVGQNRHPGKFLAGRKDLPNPNSPVNLIHGQDATELIYTLLTQENVSSIYNLCSAEHPTRKTFYVKAADLLGLERPEFQTEGKESWKLVSNQKILDQVDGFEFRSLLPELITEEETV